MTLPTKMWYCCYNWQTAIVTILNLAVIVRAECWQLPRPIDHWVKLMPLMSFTGWQVKRPVGRDQQRSAPGTSHVAIDAEATSTGGLVGDTTNALAHNFGFDVPRFASDLPKAPVIAPSLLTEREAEIPDGIACGLTNSEIAAELEFSLGTVRRDTISIYAKLSVRGRSATLNPSKTFK